MLTVYESFNKWKDASVRRLAETHQEIDEFDVELLLTEKFGKFCEESGLDRDGFEVRDFFESGLEKIINDTALGLEMAFLGETSAVVRDFLNRVRLTTLSELKFKESQERPIVELIDPRRNPGENTRL
jgi:hypothetical protein